MNTQRKPSDFWLQLIVAALMLVGLTMVFSSSSVTAAGLPEFHYDPYFFLKRQAGWCVLACVAMYKTSRLDLERFRAWSLPMIFGALALLIAVLIPHVGVEVNGARRWIPLGPFSFQPSEFAKFALVFYLADVLARRGDRIRDWQRLLPVVVIGGAIFVLIEREPDLGTALVVAASFLAVLHVAGARFVHLAAMVATGVSAVWIVIKMHPYRAGRMDAFHNPFDPKCAQTTGYHMVQSLLALGSGGWWGLGLGESRQKFFYLPEQHTDFIYAVLGEELGLVGTVSTLVLFTMLLVKGLQIASRSRDTYQALLASGIAFTIVIQGFLNMGVVSGALPLTGVPLPFISYGGTSLLITMAAVGLVVNVSSRRRERREESEEYTPSPSELESLTQRFNDSGLGLVPVSPVRRDRRKQGGRSRR